MPPPLSRRRLLLAATALAGAAIPAAAEVVRGALPWRPGEAYPPIPVRPDGSWVFFTPEEAATVEAVVDRLIPADELGAGGKAAGCAVFIDRQLAGPYGSAAWWYMQGPFPSDPLPSQGFQSPDPPAVHWRKGLAALAQYCRATFANRGFAQLAPADQDKVLTALEKGEAQLPGVPAKPFFEQMLSNTMEGYFADPIYGGNRDMVGWKLVGFPGTRYDYRDVLANPGQPYTLPPVGIMGRPAWNGGQG